MPRAHEGHASRPRCSARRAPRTPPLTARGALFPAPQALQPAGAYVNAKPDAKYADELAAIVESRGKFFNTLNSSPAVEVRGTGTRPPFGRKLNARRAALARGHDEAPAWNGAWRRRTGGRLAGQPGGG